MIYGKTNFQNSSLFFPSTPHRSRMALQTLEAHFYGDGDENGLNLTILMPILMRTMIVQNLDGWKLRRRKQSEDAIVRVSEIKRVADQEQENGGRRKS